MQLAWPSVTRATEDVAHVARMFLNWQVMCFASSLWTFYFARHLPAGLPRSLACMPVGVMLLGATPFLIDRCRAPLVIIPLIAICSISAFKVLALAIGRGPLAQEYSEWYQCLKQFHIVLSFPIIPAAALHCREDNCSSISTISSGSDAKSGTSKCNGISNNSSCPAASSNQATATPYLTAVPAYPAAAACTDACADLAHKSDPGAVKHMAATLMPTCLEPFHKIAHSDIPQTGQMACSTVCRKDSSTSSCSTSSNASEGRPVPTSPTELASYLQEAAWQVALLALSVHITQHWTFVPLFFRHWFYALLLALELQLVWDFYGLLSAIWFGMPAAQSFDRPWDSTSLADYWSRRWNLPVTYMLRVMVYDPILEGRLIPAPKAAAFASAAAAAAAELLVLRPSSVNSNSSSTDPEHELVAGAATAQKQLFHMTRTRSVGSTGSAASSTNDLCSLVADTNTELPKQSTRQSDNSISRSITDASALISGDSMVMRMPTFTVFKPADTAAFAVAADTAAAAASPAAGPGYAQMVYRKKPSQLRRFLGIQASFAFSGAWHTLIFFYATGQWIPHWFGFFALQAPAMVLEQMVQKFGKRVGVRLPTAAAAVVTNLFILVGGSVLFCRPIDSTGLNQAFYDNIMGRIAGSEWETLCKGPCHYW